ncbi:prefoldin subunit 5 isoform X1 [Diachasmimorpha longicaudata]|uniref:prefoldin subunit 5 isoform X1 n=1 Tax=Diachasmimorpha longicaudata TaxID=58733 RepID=UPI0030B917C8
MATITSQEAPHLQQIDLTKCNVDQLMLLKRQLDTEIEVFQDSIRRLKLAQNKFQQSGHCLDKVNAEIKGKEILVPLTESMYVPGRVSDTENVLVDVGTGYFIEKPVDDAKDYFKRRVAYVTEQIEKIQVLATEKLNICTATMEVIRMKIQGQEQKAGA